MTTDTRSPKLTDAEREAETDRLRRENDLLTQLAANRATRIHAIVGPEAGVDGLPLALHCPHCWSTNLRHEETIDQTTGVKGVAIVERPGANDETIVTFSTVARAIYEETADDEHLWCADCMQESQLPEDVSVEWD
jgi:hypothetical protein